MILQGHILDKLPEIASESVHCVVTSPPYWGLRDYGLPPQVWDGVEGCEHVWGEESIVTQTPHTGLKNIADKCAPRKNQRKTNRGDDGDYAMEASQGQFCQKCNAWRGSLGLEPTPEMYLQHMVEVFREIRRVMRPDATCWLNMGDSYASDNKWGGSTSGKHVSQLHGGDLPTRRRKHTGLKPKDLCGIPWRLALALRADGWWLRSDIIWAKPNPMPESVTDRPTRAHEYIFLLTRSGTPQYWTHRDLNGIRSQPQPDYRWVHASGYETDIKPENWCTSIIACPLCGGTGRETLCSDQESLFGEETVLGYADCRKCNKRRNEAAIVESEEAGHRGQILQVGKVFEWNRINLWRGHDYFYDTEAVREPHAPKSFTVHTTSRKGDGTESYGEKFNKWLEDTGYGRQLNPAGRNLHSVWNIATQPFPKAHFATFPEKLVQRCIMAGTSERGACPECGAPWERVVDVDYKPIRKSKIQDQPKQKIHPQPFGFTQYAVAEKQVKTTGWRPTCECGGEPVPCVVLDPFSGSGTVGKVAQALGRDWIGIDLSPDYCDMARKRTNHRQELLRLG